MSPRFSIVVLARNEARTLPRLVASLCPYRERGGDLLLVDTGSSDETASVARDAGCRVVEAGDRFSATLTASEAAEIERRFARAGEGPLVGAGERTFHFAQARNFAGDLARHDFVLQVDAGDEVLALDVDRLDRHLVEEAVEAFEYEQRYGNAVLQIARFCDRRRYRWEGRVHEISSRAPVGGAVGSRLRCSEAELLVRHFKDEDKPRPYLAGLALQVLEHPDAARWWHYLGRELLYRGCHRSAIEAFERHTAMGQAWQAERSQSLCFQGECHEALGETEEAGLAYRRAHEADPSRREPLLRLASFACGRGDFAAAERWARASLGLARTCSYAELAANYTWRPHSLLYWSLFWLGRREEARAHWETYLSLCPPDEVVLQHARLFPPSRAAV